MTDTLRDLARHHGSGQRIGVKYWAHSQRP